MSTQEARKRLELSQGTLDLLKETTKGKQFATALGRIFGQEVEE
jgi:hypothetical protein